MASKKILLLGDPKLYTKCLPVKKEELSSILEVIDDLHETITNFQSEYGWGRAIAAPQIGVFKRIVYMFHKQTSSVFINPVLTDKSEEMMEVWDNCMSFPDLLVKVNRHKSCRLTYRDKDWIEHSEIIEGDMSELIQHEVDHLDGVLAVSRAIDGKSFALSSEKEKL
ncbi:MAG: peptide deformylase [bacterium]